MKFSLIVILSKKKKIREAICEYIVAPGNQTHMHRLKCDRSPLVTRTGH